MSVFSSDEILNLYLKGLDDDLLEYIISVVDELSTDDKKNSSSLYDVIAPFLIDSGLADENSAQELCKKISISFGGSGYKPVQNSKYDSDAEVPMLLTAPIRMIDNNSINLQPTKATYGGAILGDSCVEDTNTMMDMSSVPTTQKQLRKMKKENEHLNRILKAEAAAEEQRRLDLLVARMAAIKVY